MVVTGTTRNRFVLDWARGFESHRLRFKTSVITEVFLCEATSQTGEHAHQLGDRRDLVERNRGGIAIKCHLWQAI